MSSRSLWTQCAPARSDRSLQRCSRWGVNTAATCSLAPWKTRAIRGACPQSLCEMTRYHGSVPHVPQLRRGSGVGADGGTALVFVQRAARGEAATAHRLLEV